MNSRPTRRLALTALAAALALTPHPSFGSPSDLDPTFGVDGQVLTFIGASAHSRDLALQPDGRFVVTGSTRPDFQGAPGDVFVMRYLSNGSPDLTFGSAGIATTDIDGGDDDAAAVAIRADGTIVVAGTTLSATGTDLVLLQYTSTGQPDPSFGIGGVVVKDFGASAEAAADLVLQPDGKLLVGFSARSSTEPFAVEFHVARFDADGTFDDSFGASGIVSGGPLLAFQPDGNLIAAGSTLRRYDGDGNLDPSFGTMGTVTLAHNADTVALQLDGKILLGGSKIEPEGCGGSDECLDGVALTLHRYNPDGTPDLGFGEAGAVADSFDWGNAAIAVVAQPDGKIAVAVRTFYKGQYSCMAITRYEADGESDATFGVVTGACSESDSAPADLVLQPDGKLVMGGSTAPSSSVAAILLRYEGSLCGNDVPEIGEQCDDGNRASEDGCSAGCTLEVNTFRCYSGHGTLGAARFVPREVDLADQLVSGPTRLVKPGAFCNPVDQDGRGTSDPAGHLTCYRFAPASFGRRHVKVHDQFGDQELTLMPRANLCVPSEKDGAASALSFDHFACYKAHTKRDAARFVPRAVHLADAFATADGEILSPEAFCAPADVDGGGILKPALHLTCYRLRPATLTTQRPPDVLASNQFGDQPLSVRFKPSTLCVPSVVVP